MSLDKAIPLCESLGYEVDKSPETFRNNGFHVSKNSQTYECLKNYKDGGWYILTIANMAGGGELIEDINF